MGWGELQIWGCSLSYQVLAFVGKVWGWRGGFFGWMVSRFHGFTCQNLLGSAGADAEALGISLNLVWCGQRGLRPQDCQEAAWPLGLQ